MTIVGINFTKMLVEKKKGTKQKINISNNVSITKVEEISLNFGAANQKSLKFSFKFTSKYEPEVGNIDFEGEVIFLTEKKKGEVLLSQWTKTKKIDPSIMTLLLNNVLNKCNIEALLLSREINLPAPIPLPRINTDKKQEKPKKQ